MSETSATNDKVRISKYVCKVHGEIHVGDTVKDTVKEVVLCQLCCFEYLLKQVGAVAIETRVGGE